LIIYKLQTHALIQNTQNSTKSTNCTILNISELISLPTRKHKIHIYLLFSHKLQLQPHSCKQTNSYYISNLPSYVQYNKSQT